MRTAEPRIDREETLRWLRETDRTATEALLARAYEVKLEHIGRKVHFRGLIECSNICRKNCFYCGIRRDNAAPQRYQMTPDEIAECGAQAMEAGYGSVVLQAGERSDSRFAAYIEDAVRRLKAVGDGSLGITLSLGEQPQAVLHRWFLAGATRYLLRIETSNPELYAKLHPEDHSWHERKQCLHGLREIGYQVGTGVMVGLPGQTMEDLAADVEFYREMDVDMIGMGPYVPHAETPMAEQAEGFDAARQLDLALRMVALTRLALPDINIAATTAMQALHPEGRELALKAGANIIMPNLTPVRYRPFYKLYDGKPCLDEDPEACRHCLAGRIAAIGEEVGYRALGDSPRFQRRQAEASEVTAG